MQSPHLKLQTHPFTCKFNCIVLIVCGYSESRVKFISDYTTTCRAVFSRDRFLRLSPFMGFYARIVPLTCKTMIMDPRGSIIAVLQVEGRFSRRFFAKICTFQCFALSFLKIDEKPSLTLQNGGYGPVMVHNRRFAR